MDNTLQPLLDKKDREVYSIQASQSVYESIAEMDAKNVGALIVKEGDKVAGIISERDYLRKVILKGRSSKETPVETIMTRDLVSVTPQNTVHDARALMEGYPLQGNRPTDRFSQMGSSTPARASFSTHTYTKVS